MPTDESGVSLQALMLADYANIREGLLNVVSAGVTRAFAAGFPLRIPTWVAMIFVIPPDAQDGLHTGTMTLKYADVNVLARAEFQIQVQPAVPIKPGEDLTFPAVIPLIDIPFPHEGEVDINVDINGAHHGSITFWITLVT